jgi:hypothetical protein
MSICIWIVGVVAELTFTKTVPFPLIGLLWNPFAVIVVVLLKAGLKIDTSEKDGDDSKYCLVAGTG